MAHHTSNAIGVLGFGISIENNQPNFFDEVLRGILQSAIRLDRDVTIIRNSLWAWEDSTPIFHVEDYAGLILLGTTFRPAVMEGVDMSGLPAVTIGGAGERPDLSSVDVDNYGSSRAAVEHLIGLGHRRIGYVSGSSIAGWAKERERAYREAMTVARLEIDEALICDVDMAYSNEGYDAAFQLLAGACPTAIAAVNDDVADLSFQNRDILFVCNFHAHFFTCSLVD